MKWAFLPDNVPDFQLSYTDTVRIISESGEFDVVYYLREHKDVCKASIDPIEHSVANGWREGRNPSATFDTKYYLRQMPPRIMGQD